MFYVFSAVSTQDYLRYRCTYFARRSFGGPYKFLVTHTLYPSTWGTSFFRCIFLVLSRVLIHCMNPLQIFQTIFRGGAPTWRLNLVPCYSDSLGHIMSCQQHSVDIWPSSRFLMDVRLEMFFILDGHILFKQ